MGIGDLMWGFLIVAALQPVIRQRLLEASRHRLIDADALQLMTLYPQPIRRQPTVEYLPGQRHAPPKREGS